MDQLVAPAVRLWQQALGKARGFAYQFRRRHRVGGFRGELDGAQNGHFG
jgi:hypothetical protein